MLVGMDRYRVYLRPGAPATAAEAAELAAAVVAGRARARRRARPRGASRPSSTSPWAQGVARRRGGARTSSSCGSSRRAGPPWPRRSRTRRTTATCGSSGSTRSAATPPRVGVPTAGFHAFAQDLLERVAAVDDDPLDPRHEARRGRAGASLRPRRAARRVGRPGCATARELAAPVRAEELDVLTEYFLWQTLVGAWPISEERLQAYALKAIRESKLFTRWTEPDEAYESAVERFVAGVVSTPRDRRARRVVGRRRPSCETRANVLGQKLVQLTMPGVPDVYQGTDLVDLSLVDPDNRRRRRLRRAAPSAGSPRRGRRSRRPPRREAARHGRCPAHASRAVRVLRRSGAPATSRSTRASACRRLRSRHGRRGRGRHRRDPARRHARRRRRLRRGDHRTPRGQLDRRALIAVAATAARCALGLPPRSAGRSAGRTPRCGQGTQHELRPLTVWAPEAQQVAVAWSVVPAEPDAETASDETVVTHDAAGRGLVVAGPRPSAQRGTPSTTPSASTAATPDPTRAARGSHAASTRRAAPSTRRHTAWGDGDWRGTRDGRGVLRRRRLRAARGHVHAGGHLRRRGGPPRPPRRARRRPRRGHARRGVRRHLGLGLRRRAAVCRPRTPTAARRPSSASSTRATHAASGWGSTSSTTTSARRGNYLAEFGPYFTDAHHTPWGPAVNLDGEGSHEVRRWIIDNAVRWFRDFHVDALRLDAVHELRDDSEPSPARRAVRRDRRSGKRARASARPRSPSRDLNDPVMVTPTAEGGRGMTAQWDDDIHHALHVALTGETRGLLRRLRGRHRGVARGWPALRARQDADRGVPARRPGLDLPRAGRGGPRSTPRRGRATSSSPTCRPTTRWATAPPATASATQVSPGQQAVGAALYLLSPFTAMVFMGEEWRAEHAVRLLHLVRGRDARARPCAHGRRAEFAAHGWAEDDVPDPQDPATRDAQRARLGRGDAPRGTSRCCTSTSRSSGCAAPSPTSPSGDLRATSVQVDEDARWIIMSRGKVHVVANLAGRAQVVPFSGEVDARARVVGPGADHQRRRRAARRPRRRGRPHLLTTIAASAPARSGRLAAVRGGRPRPVRLAAAGQDCLTRTMPSWAVVATSMPSRENMWPMARPRPLIADGDSWA